MKKEIKVQQPDFHGAKTFLIVEVNKMAPDPQGLKFVSRSRHKGPFGPQGPRAINTKYKL